MATYTLGGYDIYEPGSDGLEIPYNFFEMHTGAGRPGYGRVLMTRDDFMAMMTATPTGLVPLYLRAGPVVAGVEESATITFTVQVAGASPVDREITPSGADGGMVLVTIYDQRVNLTTPTSGYFNVQDDTFTGGGGTSSFFASTISGGAAYSWSGVMTALTLNGMGWTGLPSWAPRNLVFDGLPVGRIADDLAARLFYVVGYSPVTNVTTAYAPGTLSATSDGAQTAAADYLLDGGTTVRVAQRIPGVLKVEFPGSPVATDPYASAARTYTKAISNATGNPGLSQALPMGDFVYDGANSAELDTVATDMAARWLAFIVQPIKEATYGGLWYFIPDGGVRGVRWDFGANPKTTVRFNDARDFSPAGDIRRAMETLSNQLVVGLGGTRVGMTPAGTRRVMSRGGQGVRTPTTTVGAAAEGGDSADSGTWASTSGNALDLWVVSRVEYNDAGDQILYAFWRKMQFDSRGLLYNVTAETRGTVDTPGAC